MKKRTSLQKNIIIVTIVPMIVLGSILFAITYSHIKKTMKEQFKTELSDVAIATSAMLDFTFPGDYKTFGTDSFILMKGEVPLNDRFEFIDEVKEESSIEISVLYDNVRFLTTIRNEKGDRILGTFCNDDTDAEVCAHTRAPLSVFRTRQSHSLSGNRREAVSFFRWLRCDARRNDSKGSCLW